MIKPYLRFNFIRRSFIPWPEWLNEWWKKPWFPWPLPQPKPEPQPIPIPL